MIQNALENGKQLRFRPSDRLRPQFRTLARRLTLWRQEQLAGESSTIGITALESKVGTSTVARNLAASLAASIEGNVILVEANFQRPGITRRAPSAVGGLSDILRGDETVETCVLSTSVDRLYFLGSGRISPRAAVDLPFEMIANLNTELDNFFDFIVYDLPLADDESVCFSIAPFLSAVMIVAEPNRFPNDPMRTVKRRFEEMRTDVLGVVLNKA